MDRVWFLTWTTYGSWLTGDERGFVSNVRDGSGRPVRYNEPGTAPAADHAGLRQAARDCLAGEPVRLTLTQAAAVGSQLRETAAYRGWAVLALAVMANHIHVVVEVPGDPDPDLLVSGFKSYASRRLNAGGSPTLWWTTGASTHILVGDGSVRGAVRYVRDQEHPLVVWLADEWRHELADEPRR